VKRDIELFRKEKLKNTNPAVMMCPRQRDSEENIRGSWDNSYRNYIERMADIQENVELTRTTLYQKYNKEMFDQYCSKIENLIILENFLRKANLLISIAA
jgi:guanylate kinase